MRARAAIADALAPMLLVAPLAGCADEPPDKCSQHDPETGKSGNARITGKFVVGAPTKPATADLMVQGTIDAPDDVTVYSVDINGIAATSTTGTDFGIWSATIPLALLMQGADASGKITLTAHAITNCSGEPVELDAITVRCRSAAARHQGQRARHAGHAAQRTELLACDQAGVGADHDQRGGSRGWCGGELDHERRHGRAGAGDARG